MRVGNKLSLILVLVTLISLCLSFRITYAQEKYAVLISTDEVQNDYQAYESEFWYDLFLMYETLIVQGYTHDHIYVLYGEGDDFDSCHPRYNVGQWHPEWPDQITDYNNHKQTIDNMLNWLADGNSTEGIPEMTGNDDLFVWWMGHGSIDGACQDIYFEISNTAERVYDHEFQTYVNQIANYNIRCFCIMTCHSGGIIGELQNNSSIISTAVPCDELTYSRSYEIRRDGGYVYHAEYNYNLICALSGRDPLGNLINPDADTDDDMWVMMDEVDDYLRDNRTWFWDGFTVVWRTDPQLSDNGGLASDYPILNTFRSIFVKIDATGADDGTSWEDAYTSIQAALDDNDVGNDDTILVAPGTYYENGISFNGKSTALRSLRGPDVTIVDGNCTDSVFIFSNTEDKNSILDGFTIINGHAEDGGGIACGMYLGTYPCAPSILNCVITENTADTAGGGLSYQGALSPIIHNCTIEDNSASWGGGLYFDGNAEPAITNCTITNNTADSDDGILCGGGILFVDSSPQIINCSITGNSAELGGGFECYGSTLDIVNCIIAKNQTSEYGGGIFSVSSSASITNCTITGNLAPAGRAGIDSLSSSIVITNSILWDNSPQEIYVYSGDDPTASYSDIQLPSGTYPGTNNINSNPLFADSTGGDYHLIFYPPLFSSPCIDSGTNNGAPDADKDGIPRPQDGDGDNTATCDMGAYEYTN